MNSLIEKYRKDCYKLINTEKNINPQQLIGDETNPIQL